MTQANKPTPWFEAAAKLTRQRYTGASDVASATERRVIEAVSRRKRRPRALWLVPLAVLGSGSLAWAEEVGSALRWTVQRVQALVVVDALPMDEGNTPPVSRAGGGATGLAARSAAAPSEVEEVDTISTPELVEVPAPLGSLVAPTTGASSRQRGENATRPHASPAKAGSAQPEALAAPPPTDLERYRQGYAAQFERSDYAAALSAWDDYLRLVPGGRFTPEVRYNRALALNKLGRRREAIEALEPFAAGAYGPLRQRSARDLVEQLRSVATRPD